PRECGATVFVAGDVAECVRGWVRQLSRVWICRPVWLIGYSPWIFPPNLDSVEAMASAGDALVRHIFIPLSMDSGRGQWDHPICPVASDFERFDVAIERHVLDGDE